ncbi:MAG: ABC transporter ATP-binding protein [Ruminococcus sp.]|nr:ABC transporter ATP-binding protein [Ruminococcus sp.]MBQ8123138.1 ABC transporter ATP-binding protein [Ruminococcus sp.]
MIEMSNIIKRYYIGQPNELQILNGISLTVHEGEFVAIVGASGSGKSTLMNMIGALDKPTEGSYLLNGVDVSKLSDKQLSEIRNKEIGFVFQTFNLISRTNALKNVEMPMLYAGVSRKERSKRAMELLEMVEMEDRYTHKPNELSGGQKQRVAIARAMANDPSIILADEPTGALDSKTGRMVMDIFHKLHKKEGKTVVLITHSPELASETERIITISDGSIISDTGYKGNAPAKEVSAE